MRELISGWRVVRLVHRSVTVSMSLVRLGTNVLTMGSSTSVQSVSAGCSSGQKARQVDEPEAVRHGEVGQGVPAGVVEQQHDALLGTGTDRLGEGGEQVGEQWLGHGVGQVPHRFARGRAHEGGDIEPLEAVVAEGDGALSPWRPHRAQHRLQAEAVLVGAEHLDGDAGMGRGFLGDDVRQLFLKACASSAVADFGFLGRGR